MHSIYLLEQQNDDVSAPKSFAALRQDFESLFVAVEGENSASVAKQIAQEGGFVSGRSSSVDYVERFFRIRFGHEEKRREARRFGLKNDCGGSDERIVMKVERGWNSQNAGDELVSTDLFAAKTL